MKETKASGIRNLVRVVAILLLLSVGWQPRAFSLAQATGAEQAQARDGSHDFDFNTGVWHTHIRRVLDPFSASSGVIELDGTVTNDRFGMGARGWKRLRPTARRDIGKACRCFYTIRSRTSGVSRS